MSISRLNLIFLGFPSSDPTKTTHDGFEESGDSGSDRASLDGDIETRHAKKSNPMLKTGGPSRRVVVELDALSTNRNPNQEAGSSEKTIDPVSKPTTLTVFDVVSRSAKRALSDDIGISTCFSYLRKRRRRIMTRHPRLQGSDAVWGLTVYSGSPDFSRLCLGSNAGIIRDGEILLVVWSPLEFLAYSPTSDAGHQLSEKSHKNSKPIPTAYDREKVDVFGVIAVSGDIHNNGKPAFVSAVTAEAHFPGGDLATKAEQWELAGSSNRLFQEGIHAIEQLESMADQERRDDLMSEAEDGEASLILSPKRAAKLHNAAVETLHAISLSRSHSPPRISPTSTHLKREILEKPIIEALTDSLDTTIDRSLSTLRVDGISIEKKPRLLPYSSSSSTSAAIQLPYQQSSKPTISSLYTSKEESIIVSFEDLHDDAHVSFEVESEAATDDVSEMRSETAGKGHHKRSSSDLASSDLSQALILKSAGVPSSQQSSIKRSTSSLSSAQNSASSHSIHGRFDNVKQDKDLSIDGRSIKSISTVSSKSRSDKSDASSIESVVQSKLRPVDTQLELQTNAKNPPSKRVTSLETHPLMNPEKKSLQTTHSTSTFKQESKPVSIASIPKIGSLEKVVHEPATSHAESKDQPETNHADQSENNLSHPSSETEIFKYSPEKNSKHSSKESVEKPKPEAEIETGANDGELTPKASRAKSAEVNQSTDSVRQSLHLFQPTVSTANIFKSSLKPPSKEETSHAQDADIPPAKEKSHSKTSMNKSESRTSSRGSAKSLDKRGSHDQLKSRQSSARSESNHSKTPSSRSSHSSRSLHSRDNSHVSKDSVSKNSRASSQASKGSRDSSHASKDSRIISTAASEQETHKYRPVTIPNTTLGSNQKLRRPNSRRSTHDEVTSDIFRSEGSDSSISIRSSNSSMRSRE
ncbi:hypothetical protein HDU81_011188 [Chytriomyces hyalinus]|nr:hypothetical protein HDU81_011188 [Chytriomyces hyalinus]